MSTKKATPDNFDLVMMGIAEEIITEYRDKFNGIIDEAADIALAEVQSNSPVGSKVKGKPRRKPYAKGWKNEGTPGNRTIRNKNKPELTRWLDGGTGPRATKKGHNRGEIEGDNHISDAAETAIDYIERKILND